MIKFYQHDRLGPQIPIFKMFLTQIPSTVRKTHPHHVFKQKKNVIKAACGGHIEKPIRTQTGMKVGSLVCKMYNR